MRCSSSQIKYAGEATRAVERAQPADVPADPHSLEIVTMLDELSGGAPIGCDQPDRREPERCQPLRISLLQMKRCGPDCLLVVQDVAEEFLFQVCAGNSLLFRVVFGVAFGVASLGRRVESAGE